jgi:hypothetical protein
MAALQLKQQHTLTPMQHADRYKRNMHVLPGICSRSTTPCPALLHNILSFKAT